ncbi:MAG: hypothetical protein AB7R55_24200, partial [Gemmatimonadales bacterium]
MLARAMLILSVTMVAPATQALAQARAFDLEAMGRIVQLADPRISPDGRQVALVIRRTNDEANRFDAELTLVDVATGGRRSLAPGRH